MPTIQLAVSFALAAVAAAAAPPQQLLQAELGIAQRPGKIDFTLAVARRPEVGVFIERPDGGAAAAVVATKPCVPAVDADLAPAAATGARPQPLPPAKPLLAGPTCPGGVPIPAAPSLAGAPALLVASLSPRLAHFVALLPPPLAGGVVLDVRSLDADGLAVVSRYAAEFPAGIPLYAQAVALVDGQILASDMRRFTGAGRRAGR
ncbi:MAG: hypothetical protein ACK6DT_18400 [Planctomycetota bacterium]